MICKGYFSPFFRLPESKRFYLFKFKYSLTSASDVSKTSVLLEYIIENFLGIYVLEVGAAIAGSVYITKAANPALIIKIFVYYLWFMVFVETLGLYPAYAYYSNYTSLSFIKDTPFEQNRWLYNIHKIIALTAYISLFISHIGSHKARRIFWALLIIFVISSTLNLIFSGSFFLRHTVFATVSGTLLLLVIILVYYYELLRSNQILDFYYNLTFYISVGALVWHLIVTPLFIYNRYFSLQSPDFVLLHSWILRIANIILYGMIITGFLFSYRTEKRKLRNIQGQL